MVETWRAGDTSVERLSWSSAWMASVEGWKGGWSEGELSEWETAVMAFGDAWGGGMLGCVPEHGDTDERWMS